MSRLPTPGSDDGNWGEILNDFLEQSHNSDGSLKSSAIPTIAASDVITSDSSTVQAKITDHASQLAASADRLSRRETISRRFRMPMITIIDDDFRANVKTFWPSIMQAKSIPITLAIPTGLVGSSGQYMGWSDLDILKQYNFEFVMHGHNHVDLGALPVADALADVRTAQAAMRAHGLPDDKLVYPFNSTTGNLRAALRPLLRCAFAGTGYTTVDYNVPPIQTYNITRIGLQRSNPAENMTLEQMQTLIDNTVTNNGWLVWVSHCYLDTMPTSQIEAMIDYAKAVGMEFVTVEEGLNRIGNVVEAGAYPTSSGSTYTVLDANGTLHSNGFAPTGSRTIVYGTANQFTNANVPTDFLADCVTINYVDNAHASGLPGGIGGILETYRLSGTSGYGMQQITQVSAQMVYQRRILTDGSFGDWVPKTPIIRTYAPSTAPTYSGSFYVDTTNQKVYIAMGTSAISDWKQLQFAT